MTDFLDHLIIIVTFLLELSKRDSIKVTEREKLRLQHHKIAERNYMIIEYLEVTTVEKNPNIPGLLEKIDEQILNIDQVEPLLKDLFSLIEQLISEFDTLLAPAIKRDTLNEEPGVLNPQGISSDLKEYPC